MRHKLVLLSSILLAAGCNKETSVTGGSSAATAAATDSEEVPYIWGNKTFPKVVKISSSFNSGQKAVFREMGETWNTSVDNKVFFSTNSSTDNTYNINEPDSVMGIYKATDWPDDASTDALAITQIFGRRFNSGKSNEYVSIVHADIIVNYAPDSSGALFQFDYDDAGDDSGYDLRSVILHEMGHFLGLQHIPTWYNRPTGDPASTQIEYRASSVMYPSISHLDEKRVPKTKDINALAKKYSIGGSANALVASGRKVYEPDAQDAGSPTKIIMELRKNGECVHRENGAVIRRHQIKL